MANKYLDTTGLAYLWGKLKDYFQAKLVSGTNIKTINNNSLLGSGNIDINGGITTETDPTVPAWAKESTKPTYTASEVGAIATPSSISDFNNVTEAGLYYYSNNTTNRPTGTTIGGTCLVLKFSDNYYTQIAFSLAGATATNQKMYIRHKIGGTWQAWYVVNETELPAVTSSDDGKVLRVVNGEWSAESLPSASGVSF